MTTGRKNIFIGLFLVGVLLIFAGCNGDVDLGYDLEECNFAMDIDQSTVEVDTPIGYAIQTNPDTGVPDCYGVFTAECSGSDCDQMYETREDCQEDIDSCIQDVLDHNCFAACQTMYDCYQGDLDIQNCIDTCTDQESQEVPYYCAEGAECVAESTCDEISNQECNWYSDCMYSYTP